MTNEEIEKSESESPKQQPQPDTPVDLGQDTQKFGAPPVEGLEIRPDWVDNE